MFPKIANKDARKYIKSEIESYKECTMCLSQKRYDLEIMFLSLVQCDYITKEEYKNVVKYVNKVFEEVL